MIGAADWNAGLKHWLGWRRRLYDTARISVDYELHAYNFINGRGNPSQDEAWNRRKAFRHEVARDALQTVAAIPGARVGAVYRYTNARRDDYAVQRRQVYGQLIDRHQHRGLKLADRRIIEDPLFQGGHSSQLLQIADLVAYTAYQAVYRDPVRAFMHDWFARYLDPIGTLVEV